MTGANSQALLPVWIFVFFNKLILRCSDLFITNQGAKAARSQCWFMLPALLIFSADLQAQTPGLIYNQRQARARLYWIQMVMATPQPLLQVSPGLTMAVQVN